MESVILNFFIWCYENSSFFLIALIRENVINIWNFMFFEFLTFNFYLCQTTRSLYTLIGLKCIYYKLIINTANYKRVIRLLDNFTRDSEI